MTGPGPGPGLGASGGRTPQHPTPFCVCTVAEHPGSSGSQQSRDPSLRTPRSAANSMQLVPPSSSHFKLYNFPEDTPTGSSANKQTCSISLISLVLQEHCTFTVSPRWGRGPLPAARSRVLSTTFQGVLRCGTDTPPRPSPRLWLLPSASSRSVLCVGTHWLLQTCSCFAPVALARTGSSANRPQNVAKTKSSSLL